MTAVKVVLFDLYNTLIATLIDSNPYERMFTYWGWYLRRDLDKMHDIVLTETLKDTQEVARRFKSRHTFITRRIEDEMRNEIGNAVLLRGAVDVLKDLRARGYKLGIVSNVATPYIDPVYRLSLDTFVDELVFSCEIGLKKPDPAIFEHACKLFGVKPVECIMVGDQLKADFIGAKQAGLKALLFDPHDNNQHLKNRINDLGEIPYLLKNTGIQIK